ncbi:MAG TPA: hypothetical protein PKA64_18730, partial [Myxococcota bacterium]|nr:hypothetical protein [Myxococcota bacterium]
MRTWLLWVGLAGCGAGEADREAEDLAAIAEDDLAWLAETALGVAAGVEGAPAGQPIEAVDDFDGVGDCTWSASWEGNPLTGSWLVALDPTPCGGETGGGLGYELDEGAFGGDWRATGAGAWTITGAGERAARLTT